MSQNLCTSVCSSFTKSLASNVMDLIGKAPLILLKKVTKGCQAQIAVKLEFMNPTSSVKSRIAYAMVTSAEQEGKIRPGVTTLIEPTSGNTGVALAFIAASKGYNLILTMPSSMSLERRVLLRSYGSKLVLTDPELGMQGSINRARDLQASIPGSFILQQFENPANPLTHYQTTGPEIWEQTNGKVDACVFGVGTGGTITGVGQFLKEKNHKIKVYAVEPKEAAVLSGYPFAPHKIQGLGAGFVPKTLDTTIYDDIITVHSDEAIQMSRQLALTEGLLCGISSGANVCAAIQIASKREMEGKLIVTALPSLGERYLSSELYFEMRQEVMKMGINSLEENLKQLKS